MSGCCKSVMLSLALALTASAVTAEEACTNIISKGGGFSDPVLCSTMSSSRSPGCTISNGAGTSKTLELSLDAKNSCVQDVNGVKTNTITYNGEFTPPILEVRPGDTLRFKLSNHLCQNGEKCDEHDRNTNLHTHGLLVSPLDHGATHGDNILVTIKPNTGNTIYEIKVPSTHPEGLYWYHPHIHGSAAKQIGGGMSGLIAVREGLDSNARKIMKKESLKAFEQMYLNPELRERRWSFQAKILGFVDNRPGIDKIKGFIGREIRLLEKLPRGAYKTVVGNYFERCKRKLDAIMETKIKYLSLKSYPGKPVAYLVNNQDTPKIAIDKDKNHLWCIANQTANDSLVLELIDSEENSVPFQVVTVDGVIPKSEKGTENVPLPTQTKLLLMPAGRADVLIRNDGANPQSGKTLSLRARKWPFESAPVVLATVDLAPTPSMPGSDNGFVWLSEPMGAESAKPSPSTISAIEARGDCIRPLKAKEYRRITLVDANKIGSEIVHYKDNKEIVDSGMTIEPKTYEPEDWKNKHVCVPYGAEEIWEVVNDSVNLLHNFHLHQSKFSLASAKDFSNIGMPEDTSPIQNLDGALQDLFATKGVTVYHDTLPVPWTTMNGGTKTQGRIFIKVSFKNKEQIGRYVFHCHLLDHEDKGMMAPIEVVRKD